MYPLSVLLRLFFVGGDLVFGFWLSELNPGFKPSKQVLCHWAVPPALGVLTKGYYVAEAGMKFSV